MLSINYDKWSIYTFVGLITALIVDYLDSVQIMDFAGGAMKFMLWYMHGYNVLVSQ